MQASKLLRSLRTKKILKKEEGWEGGKKNCEVKAGCEGGALGG